MSKGLKTMHDGTLNATLGKKLVKSIKFLSQDARTPLMISGKCKEISFAVMPDQLSIFIDKIDEDHRLTIEDKSSVEANVNTIWVQVDSNIPDDNAYEIWIWN